MFFLRLSMCNVPDIVNTVSQKVLDGFSTNLQH